MWKSNILILLTLQCTAVIAHAQYDLRKAYKDKYKDIAISEMAGIGISASIKLAQGVLESNGGQSTLAKFELPDQKEMVS